MPFALAPWHLWGNTQVLAPVVTGLTGNIPFQSNQLVKAQYKRPESWRFLFSATVLSAPDTGGGTLGILVGFDLTLGTGRSVIQVPSNPFALPFVSFRFQYVGVAANIIGHQKWASRAPQSLLDDSTPASAADPRQYIDTFVAEDIQLQGRVGAVIDSGPAIGELVNVQLDAFIAPASHIRPEWYRDSDSEANPDDEETRFRGQEQDGT